MSSSSFNQWLCFLSQGTCYSRNSGNTLDKKPDLPANLLVFIQALDQKRIDFEQLKILALILHTNRSGQRISLKVF
jgi:hypothetical protein